MTLQPRRRYMRGSKVTFPTLPPLKPRQKTAQLPKLSSFSKECSPTTQSTRQIERTTSQSPAKETTWWPSGVYLGNRPPRTHLPLHIINPDLFKWERKFPKIWFRTGGTKYTYAPEVVNYPITFNWSIPRDKRVDKYTEKPDWPLNSPLFGSNEIYDYLEEVTLPSPPVSGETEYPQTTPLPWWTFPPWWEKKVDKEEKSGKKIKPKEAIYVRPVVSTSTDVDKKKTPIKSKMNPTTLGPQINFPPASIIDPSTTKRVLQTLPTVKSYVTNVVHHSGPWWKLTIVEHEHQECNVTKRNAEGHRKKRSIHKQNPLVRQNAFRRKWKGNCQTELKNKTYTPSKHNNTLLDQSVTEQMSIDLNKATNWSSHSIENTLNEVVSEIPMESIRKEIKKGIFTELHTDKIRKSGRKEINTEVISKMAEFEAENECEGIDQETDKSVKSLIQKLLKEILFFLRGNKWMKDTMINIFEDGYSVRSVVETIVSQLSIESILDAMGKEGLNITKPQKDLVLGEFKNYKPQLTKMLEKEIRLWDNQLNSNSPPNRLKRFVNTDLSVVAKATFPDSEGYISFINKNMNQGREEVRKKRNIDAINSLPGSLENVNDEKDGINIDKEISALKKSSLSDVEKIRQLKKRLKWLQSQTENPSDIVFPESFEERLMITENYDDDKSKAERGSKKRYQWSVRTKKPTLKTVTFLPKIRLARGKIFVPLTTTEEQLVIPETSPPTLKRKRMRAAVSRKKIKLIDPEEKVTLRSTRRPLLQRTKAPYKATVDSTSKIKTSRKHQRNHIVTSIPVTLFPTLGSFKTMKFGKNTQKEVISLQEFLKRRNEYRRVKEEVMWNKNFLFSSGEGVTTMETPSLVDVREEKDDSTDEEEELSFEAKLSGEIKASDFTLRPLSDFLFTKPTQSLTKDSKKVSDISTLTLFEGSNYNSKEHTTFNAKRKKVLPTSKPSNKSKSTTLTNLSQNESHDFARSHSSVESNRKRRKRNVIQKESSFTYEDLRKSKTEEYGIGVDHGSKVDDSLIGARQNISRRHLEQKIQNRAKMRANAIRCPNIIIESTLNDSAGSFETYQQEHKKWFGARRRGVPVNNFDIDWDQMRRKLEVQDLSIWQKQKEANKFGGKEVKNYWDLRSKTSFGNKITSTGQPSLAKSYEILPKTKKKGLARNKEQRSSRHAQFNMINKLKESERINEGNDFEKDSLEPPYGKADRNGKTAFGRLYEEPKKRHYRVFDNRDQFFDEKDIKNLINNTYCADFRIMTHRKTHWHNRTFDPNYIFTQNPTEQNKTTSNFTYMESNKLSYDEKLIKSTESHSNDSKTAYSDFHSYVNILKENRFMSLRPKHQSFKDKFNNTVIINQDNDTFILQRSKRIPLDNQTDINAYLKYKNSRKKFYNKTIDIVFSYYIFHKFKCGNSTRDLGYGRMSNVVNRWYNRTFVPKYRPDMFYVHNRYKAGKELNFFKNEFNILHSMMSEGTFDPSRWGHVLPSRNSRNDSLNKIELNETVDKNKNVRERDSTTNLDHNPYNLLGIPDIKSIRPSVRNFKTDFKYTKESNATTVRLRSQHHSTMMPFRAITKKSFFKTVKDKGFVFLKSLFGITNKKNDASK